MYYNQTIYYEFNEFYVTISMHEQILVGGAQESQKFPS